MPKLRPLFRAFAVGLLFAAASPSFADEPPKDAAAKAATPADAQKEEQQKVQSFADSLKQREPEAYKRFTELREARDQSLEKLKKAQEELKKANGEEKINAFVEFKENRKKYVEAYIAFIAFLDERDQTRLVKIDENIKTLEKAKEQIRAVIENRKKAREELEKALKES